LRMVLEGRTKKPLFMSVCSAHFMASQIRFFEVSIWGQLCCVTHENRLHVFSPEIHDKNLNIAILHIEIV